MSANQGFTTLSASQAVMERAYSVTIDPAAVQALAQDLAQDLDQDLAQEPSLNKHWLLAAPARVLQFLEPLSCAEQALFMLIFHAAGFSYWQDPPWSIGDGGTTYNGSSAWLICLARDHDLLKPAILATLSDKRWQVLTLGLNNISMPMAGERLEILRSLGSIWQDQQLDKVDLASVREAFVADTDKDAPSLALLVADTLPGFADISNYDELKIPFLKRAQLLVNDINYLKIKHAMQPISGLERLTAFADYKIPQVLRHKNVLKYNQTLAQKIDTLVPLTAGSKEEIEIRAATIVAVEAIKNALKNSTKNPTKKDDRLYSSTLDNLLWLKAQKAKAMRPYHRCRTIYY